VRIKEERCEKMVANCKEKLELMYFVMATQASRLCCSFYNALHIFSKKKKIGSLAAFLF